MELRVVAEYFLSGEEAVQGDVRLVRAVRLTQIQNLLHRNPQGLTTKELAELCGVCQRTIQRDLLSLQSDLGIPITQHGDKYGIMQGYILPPVSLSLYEAMALFLTCRLALRQIDKNNNHVEAALTKLASVLPPGLREKLHHSIATIANKPADPRYVRIFEQIAIAWATQRRIRIRYQSLRRTETKEWYLDPYFVEMTGVGYSAYVIGYAKHEEREGLVTFKLDRIQEAELLNETFEIPADLNLDRLLASSWGIMWDNTATEVKLKFSPHVARRVKESVWHPSQHLEDLPDGGCTLALRIANVLEMVPWIRGWGPDVEVLEPKELRRTFREYAEHLCKIYCGEE